MERTKLGSGLGLLLAIASAVLPGCSAKTNTLDIDSGKKSHTYRKAEVEELKMAGRSFPLIDRDESQRIFYNGQPLNKNNVLGVFAVPQDNSRIVRTPNSLEVIPTTTKYVLVNAFFTDDGRLEINTSDSPKKSFFVTSLKPTKSRTESKDGGIMQKRTYDTEKTKELSLK